MCGLLIVWIIQFNDRMRTCQRVPPREIIIYRTLGMMVFYSIYYVIRPKKLIGFIRNLFAYTASNSVFEQRIIQNLRRKLTKTAQPSQTFPLR